MNKLGCCPFKTECNALIHVLSTVYVHSCVYVNTRQNGDFDIILCVFLRSCDAKEYSRAVSCTFCVCVCVRESVCVCV